MAKMILGYKPNQFTAPDIFKYDISHYAKSVYVFLQRCYTVEGETAPSKNEIAYYVACSKRKVDDAIKELEEVGLIQIIRRKKSPKVNDTNLYIIYHPDQIEELKLLVPYEEIKYAKKKQKSGAGDALPKKVVQEMHYPEKGGAQDALPFEESRNDADSQKKLVQEMHGTISTSLDIDSLEDSSISDEEIIKKTFKEHLKEDISLKQAEAFVDVALEKALSLDEVIDEIQYIAKHVKIKKTASGTLYTSLNEGGWSKKKREEAEKVKQEQRKPKRRLTRKPSGSDLPQSLREQQAQPAAPEQEQDWSDQEAEIRAKLKELNRKFQEKAPVY